MHPRLRGLNHPSKNADSVIAYLIQDSNKPFTKGEAVGVIFMFLLGVYSILYLALTH